MLFSLPERVKGPGSALLAQVTLKPAKPSDHFSVSAASAPLGLPRILKRDWNPHTGTWQATMASSGLQASWNFYAVLCVSSASRDLRNVAPLARRFSDKVGAGHEFKLNCSTPDWPAPTQPIDTLKQAQDRHSIV
ncbi:hypothetical protein OPT61_g3550 [Boeremia exigua]|uniref:Uncharacterized protein n=1 Tax=Boeremia exigua TaxID=749465 RepID=A0ACC2IHJ2_9PLEO|nr:hypothetical protein OPT61_g3550 [Boeremia exigua]